MSDNNAGRSVSVVEAQIADLRQALEEGRTTAVELVAAYLNRIAHFDRHGICLNAVPVLDHRVFAEALASDRRRRAGRSLGPLDGIPYTAKASYKATGLPVSAGAPALEHLVASDDAFAIERLRQAGAVLVGLTNMPPMANGGMQRGVYGRAESPYNPAFLAAAYGSGSSNGSGVATTASMAAFGLGEETWSSGRAPASNNSLVAYTPSRGLISMRGNWPLFPTMDVVVPHTRSMRDLLEILDVLVVDDHTAQGDFWRAQRHVPIRTAGEVRPDDFASLARADALQGVRLGVPRMYINRDDQSQKPITTRPSVIALWEAARSHLEALGAQVVEVDFPAVSNYDEDRPGARSMVSRGIVPQEFADVEEGLLVAVVWNELLRVNGQPGLDSFENIDPALMFPIPPGSLPDPDGESEGTAVMAELAKAHPDATLDDVPRLGEALKGLELTRKLDFEDWLDGLGLDGLVFPANADVAPHNADYDPTASATAWRNGVAFSNGNAAIRHLGIPTVTVPMGLMEDTGMPVGLTFAGRAYDDTRLLSYGFAFEQAHPARQAPPSTPDIGDQVRPRVAADPSAPAGSADTALALRLETELTSQDAAGDVTVLVRGSVVDAVGPVAVQVHVNGNAIAVETGEGHRFEASCTLRSLDLARLHSPWRGPYGAVVVVTAADGTGRVAGAFDVVGGIS